MPVGYIGDLMNETRDQNRYIIRFPPGLRERIAAYAKANGRSMNSEIVATLLEQYPDIDAEFEDRLDSLQKLIVDNAGPIKGQTIYKAVTELVGFIATVAETHNVNIDPGINAKMDETEHRIAEVAERLRTETPKQDPRVGRPRRITDSIARKTK